MAGEIETIEIDNGKGGYIIINKDDYDEKKHKKYNKDALKLKKEELKKVLKPVKKLKEDK